MINGLMHKIELRQLPACFEFTVYYGDGRTAHLSLPRTNVATTTEAMFEAARLLGLEGDGRTLDFVMGKIIPDDHPAAKTPDDIYAVMAAPGEVIWTAKGYKPGKAA